jgi:DNA-binding XRE family transcriptional regulator
VLARVQRVEIGDAVDAQDNGLTIDDELLLPVLQGRFHDPRVALGPVVAATRNQPDALAGLTQKALAAETGIAMQTLNHMEAAGHAPALGHKKSQALVLAALGAHGIMLVPKGAVLVS